MKFRTTLKLVAASIAAASAWPPPPRPPIHRVRLRRAPDRSSKSHYGEDMQNGLNLALEEANKKGIKADGQPRQVRAGVARPGRIRAWACRRGAALVDEDAVGIRPLQPGTTIPASRVYHEAGLPQIAMATCPNTPSRATTPRSA